ncbi:hypothetical protein [Streptomyces sp. NPDC046985]|uniref:hypothetical protein n=1 Tax=Streptomyces sp. NPDC046985 TaxID=3155377 RepID=UPI0033D2B7E0
MSTPTRARNRRLTAAALTAAALALVAVTPALAGTAAAHTTAGTAAAHTAADGARTARTAARAAAAPVAQGDARDVTQRVADFYGAYIDTVWDGEDPAAAGNLEGLKSFYLSAAARGKVAAYEAREHADGVLFAQNVPVKWQVAFTGTGAGHATSRVTLIWGDRRDATVTRIDVESDLRTRKITDLRPVD